MCPICSDDLHLIGHSVYGREVNKIATVASNYTDASQNPVVLLDNIELDDFNKGLSNFFLTSVNGVFKEKRKQGTDSENIEEEAHSLLASTGIESLGKTEHINRLLFIEFDLDQYSSENWSERVYNKIDTARPELFSAHMQLISRVLTRIKHGEMEKWEHWITSNYPKHNKSRSNSYLSLMAMVICELAPFWGVQFKDVENIIRGWIEEQNNSGLATAVDSNPIIVLLENIHRDHCTYNDSQTSDYQTRYDGKVISGTASEFHTTFCVASKRRGLRYRIENPVQLAQRIKDVKGL
ncbi:hypothetical protein KKA08_04230, partial [bacterium]|nr:hypothetical protein [bacterium]